MPRNIPQIRTWRVTVHWATPQSTTERRHYYANAPNKRFAWWNARDGILLDVGAERFIDRSRVTISLAR